MVWEQSLDAGASCRCLGSENSPQHSVGGPCWGALLPGEGTISLLALRPQVGLGEVAEELLELSSVVGEGHMGWKVLLPGVVWREMGCQQRPL